MSHTAGGALGGATGGIHEEGGEVAREGEPLGGVLLDPPPPLCPGAGGGGWGGSWHHPPILDRGVKVGGSHVD